jgi:hypothetical protein
MHQISIWYRREMTGACNIEIGSLSCGLGGSRLNRRDEATCRPIWVADCAPSSHGRRDEGRSGAKFTVAAGSSGTVSALLIRPSAARACFVFAHGAGAGITHPSMEAAARGLVAFGADRTVACAIAGGSGRLLPFSI